MAPRFNSVGILRDDVAGRRISHVRKSGSGPAGNRARFASLGGERSIHNTTAAPVTERQRCSLAVVRRDDHKCVGCHLGEYVPCQAHLLLQLAEVRCWYCRPLQTPSHHVPHMFNGGQVGRACWPGELTNTFESALGNTRRVRTGIVLVEDIFLSLMLHIVLCCQLLTGAAVSQWLGRSPPTTAIRARYPAGSLPDSRTLESCPEDAACQRGFSGYSRFSRPRIPRSLHHRQLRVPVGYPFTQRRGAHLASAAVELPPAALCAPDTEGEESSRSSRGLRSEEEGILLVFLHTHNHPPPLILFDSPSTSKGGRLSVSPLTCLSRGFPIAILPGKHDAQRGRRNSPTHLSRTRGFAASEVNGVRNTKINGTGEFISLFFPMHALPQAQITVPRFRGRRTGWEKFVRSMTYWLDSTVLCTLESQMFVRWLLPQRVVSATSHLAAWHSLLVSLQVCYWLRVVQGVSNKLRSDSRTWHHRAWSSYPTCEAPARPRVIVAGVLEILHVRAARFIFGSELSSQPSQIYRVSRPRYLSVSMQPATQYYPSSSVQLAVYGDGVTSAMR
ncbi:hypothetical protein PR048_030198 [Dryococelus australis]|uniref:Uncharacterized protein n=1 Tax=Dryococelus australis TaxID=614101 RepID=A0ABQ9G8A0_9NEOP|nr:hypothetical protein PR048_030198 [Dryococelus australis]